MARTLILRAGQISDNSPTALIFMDRRNHGGFTLLELIVVLVIISLMSALVVPKLAGPMSNLDLRTAAKKISASLRYVRSHAASEKTTYAALFDFEKNSLVIINPPSATGADHRGNRGAFDRTLLEPPTNEKVRPGGFKTYNLPDGVKLLKGVSREGASHSGYFPIYFFPSGGSSGGEVTVANERGRQYKIIVDFVTGTVQLSEVMG